MRTNRKRDLLEHAVCVAIDHGYPAVSFGNVAKAAQVSKSLVCHYYPTTKRLKRAVLKYALEHEVTEVIIQAVVLGLIKLEDVNTDVKKRIHTFFDN